MLKIGLTGGVGSGKTTVAHMFHALDVPVIDADLIARNLLNQDLTVVATITKHFGKKILDHQGNMDRGVLRDIIFTHPNERKWLEELLHPRILLEIQHQVDQLVPNREFAKNTKSSTRHYPYCMIVIPLLIEAVQSDFFVDRILVVDTSVENQIQRVQARDAISQTLIQKMMDAQVSRSERLKAADDVIHNEGNLERLQEQVLRLHKQYVRIALQLR